MSEKNKITTKNFDIIGDIHGHSDALIRLLSKMGYSKNSTGIYNHLDRTAIFVGDFIDRGPKQAHVINIVKSMVETGNALAVMGNHEFNAIAYHTCHPTSKLPLREQSAKNYQQHEAFLKEYPVNASETTEVIDWFKTLPIYLDLDNFRVVHACWNNDVIQLLKPMLNVDNTIPQELLIKASNPDNKEFHAIEILLKGMEIPLPEGNSFHDKDNNPRHDIRVKWWAKDATTYRDYALVQQSALNNISDKNLSEHIRKPKYTDSKPVFFGHYWFSGTPKIIADNVVCLDYSVGNKEKLVCYQFNQGDKRLSNNNFVMVNA